MKKLERPARRVLRGMEHPSVWDPRNVSRGNCWNCGKPRHFSWKWPNLLQPGKRWRTGPKGLSSVPRRYQRPLHPRAGTLRGKEDQLRLYISSKVEGVNVKFLVDTGSNITILSPAVPEKISAPRRAVLEEVENHMILAYGSGKALRGKRTFELEVEGKRALQEAWIADTELEGILGMDFVCRYGYQIITAPGGLLELCIPELTSASGTGAQPAEVKELRNYRSLRVVVEDTALVPANSEMIATAKVDKCDVGLAILEPTLELVQCSKLLVGRSLVKMDGPIVISLLNPTSYPRRVYKNTLAALCEPIDRNQVDGEPWLGHSQKAETEVRDTQGSQPKECQHQDQQISLSSELEELINRSTMA